MRLSSGAFLLLQSDAFKISNLNAENLDFQIEFDSGAHLAYDILKNEDAFVYSDGVRYSVADGNLLPVDFKSLPAQTNKLGDFDMNIWTWEFGPEGNIMMTVMKNYFETEALIFETHLPRGVENSSAGRKDTTCTGWPALKVNEDNDDIGFTTPGGNVMGWTMMAAGKYKLDELRVAPLEGRFMADRQGGITLLYGGDSHQMDAVILSPFNEFMTQHNVLDMDRGQLYFGIQGDVKSIPAGFVASSIIVGSRWGIRDAIDDWGLVMRTWYDRTEAFRHSDIFNTHLGYNTNAGAYYYYNTEGDMNYEDTMAFAADYFRADDIPIRWMQYDSWFYEKGRGAGVKTWIPTEKKFPSGPQAAYHKHGHQLQCHNRWWAPDNTYAKQNGGEYDFIIEPDGVTVPGPIEIEVEGPNGFPITIPILDENGYTKGPFSLPNDDRFWMDFFKDVKTWGVESYLQDWMMDTYLFMNATQESVDFARNWLVNMGHAADAHDINIQYCLTLTRCGLQALEIPRVTQVRVSADYAYNFAQWTIGLTSLIADNLGMAPHKDTFYTVREMPDNNNFAPENYPDLHSAVATLSTGPVTFGDKPGTSNYDVLLRCCRKDGKILKPSRPLTAIDAQIRSMGVDIAHGTGAATGFNGTVVGNSWNSQGQVWTTYSDISGYKFGIIFNGILTDDYQIFDWECNFPTQNTYVYKEWPERQELGENAFPVTLSSEEKWGLHHVSPVIRVDNYNVVIIGEQGKWARMSPQRVTRIQNYQFFLLLELDGSPGEEIFFNFLIWRDGEEPRPLIGEVTFGSNLKASLKIENGRLSVSY